MRIIFTILFFFTSLICFAQPTQTNPYLGIPKSIALIKGWLKADSGFVLLPRDTIMSPLYIGEQRFRLSDSSIYVAISTASVNGNWIKQRGGGGGGITPETLTFGTFLTGGSYDGISPITTGVDTSSADFKAFIGHYAKDSVVTIYTGDGSLPSDRTVDLNGHGLTISQNGFPFLQFDPSGVAAIAASDGISITSIQVNAGNETNAVYFNIESTDGVNDVQIYGDPVENEIDYTADTHTFNGNIVASNLATGGSAPATSGTRQGVIGDANGLLSFTNKTFDALAFGATTTWNYLTGYNKTLTLTGDADLVLTNVQDGDQGTLIVVQDGSGGHELTVPDAVLTINTDAGDTTVIGFINQNGTYYWATSVGGGGGGAVWGAITGTLSDQTDLQTALNAKVPTTTTVNGKALSSNITLGLASADFANQGTTTTVLHGNASGNPSFGQIVNADVSGSAAIAYSKLNLTGSILNADLAGSIAASKLVGSDIATVGTITSGTWNGGVIAGLYGGTGVANSGKTITLGGNLTTSGAFNTTFTVTGSNTITFPNASITVARIDAAQTFTGVQTFSSAPVIGSITNTGLFTLPTVAGTAMQYAPASTASSGAPAPTGDAKVNELYITAQAASAAFAAPSGSLTNGNILRIRIKDNGTARALTWDAIYVASPDIPLPSTTILGKTMYLAFSYNSATPAWNLTGFVNNF